MDFPKNPAASAYYREEVFAAVVGDTLQILFARIRFRRVLIVNRHGADNQRAVLDRLCREFNVGCVPQRVRWVYLEFPRSLVTGSIGQAASEETWMLVSRSAFKATQL